MGAHQLVADIQRLAMQGADSLAPDNELLQRFAQKRDESAFTELVRRHGSLVLGVGRRVLGDHHIAEDVLQATFCLLARKADAVAWKRTIAPWLYSVAYRLARTARRRRRPVQSLSPTHLVAAGDARSDPSVPLLWNEVAQVLDEELGRLSEPLRTPLVLCYLQGHTRDEAALSLGWTLATLKRRLEQGRNNSKRRFGNEAGRSTRLNLHKESDCVPIGKDRGVG